MARQKIVTLPTHRATAWLLAFVCLWMGTDGVMHHTDPAEDGRSASPQMVLSRHAAVQPTADACAACEWTQGLQSSPMTVCAVPSPFFVLTSPALLPAGRLCARPLLHRAPRAPPVFLA